MNCLKNLNVISMYLLVKYPFAPSEKVSEMVGTPFLSDRNPWSEEESLERPGIGYRVKLAEEGLLREIESEEEKAALVETHEASTQTPGAGPSTIPNNARVLEMVLWHRDAAAAATYAEYVEECAAEEARWIEDMEDRWWGEEEVVDEGVQEFRDLD